MRRALAVLVASAWSSAALAEDPPVEPPPPRVALQWVRGAGAEGCVSAEALERSINALLERPTFVPRASADVVAHGRVEKTPDGWAAHLAMNDASGTLLGARDLHSEATDCASLDESLELVFALAVDSLRGTQRAFIHATPAPAEKPWHAEVSVTAAGSAGILPGVAAGFGFGAAIQPPSFWPIGLDVVFWLPRTAEERGHGAEFTGWQLGLSLCAPIITKVIEPRVCLEADVGRLDAAGFGVAQPASPSAWLADLELRGVAVVHLGDRVLLLPGVGASVPFVRDRFYYTLGDDPERRVLHQPWPVAFLFDLGLGIRI